MKALGKPKAMKKRLGLKAVLKNNWQLYLLVLPAVIYFVVFNYLPLYGIQIAFKDYKAVDGIAGSAWVGLKHFKNFFNVYYFKRLLSNTLLLNVYYLLWSFPVPLILAILLNQIRGTKKKRFIQTSIYVPYFISTVVLAGMLYIFLSPTSGILNFARTALGLKAIDFMSDASAFRSIYIISVSYTHLDVYKRQLLGRVRRQKERRRPGTVRWWRSRCSPGSMLWGIIRGLRRIRS